MRDIAHDETERILAKMEKEVASVYTQAQKELSEKLDDYLKRFETKDAIWQKNVADGKRTVEEYKQWKQGQMLAGYRWQAMRDQIAEDLHESNALARSIVMGYRPEVYAINHNYATYRIEKAAKVNTGYTLYSRETVEKILRDQPELLPPPTGSMQKKLRDYKKATGKDIAWQKGQLQSVMTQAVLQGESIPNISKRIANTLGEMNHKSTIRYARTAITGAQNAGRMDAYKRASDMGIGVKQQWVATIDFRTRHEHRMLDQQIVEIGEPFEVDGYKIMFPADPTAEPEMIWNCRCTTIAVVEGLNHDFSGRSDEAIQDMSYDDWKESRYEESDSITKQEEIADIMKQRYINEYYGGGSASGGAVEEEPVSAVRSSTIDEANQRAQSVLEQAYENHRIENETRSVPVADFSASANPIKANYGKMSVESADVFTSAISDLSSKYDTPLTQIRTMTKEEFMFHRNSFAFVAHDYTTDTATLVLNPSKCKNIGALASRITELSESGYCVKVKQELAEQYVATHEFAHTILNMQNPLNDKTNWVGANYGTVRSARKEVEAIYEDYMREVSALMKTAKDYETQYLFASSIDEMEKLRKLGVSAYDALDSVKLSDYSLSDVDEFFAEAFANETIGINSNAYARRVMDVVRKHFGRNN